MPSAEWQKSGRLWVYKVTSLRYDTVLSCRHQPKSPYQVVKAPNGDFFFATSLDIHYLISFEEEEPLGQCDTYQFVIQKLDMQRSPHDPKVEQTILAIINQFFIEHLNVLLYMCDDSDGREANRNRLFLSWFQKHAEPNRFTIRSANATVEGKGLK